METPEGFEPHFRKSGLTDPWEPIFSKVVPGEAVILGLRIGPAHVNSRGLAHGGLLAALADNAMGLSCIEQAGRETVSGLLTASKLCTCTQSAGWSSPSGVCATCAGTAGCG